MVENVNKKKISQTLLLSMFYEYVCLTYVSNIWPKFYFVLSFCGLTLPSSGPQTAHIYLFIFRPQLSEFSGTQYISQKKDFPLETLDRNLGHFTDNSNLCQGVCSQNIQIQLIQFTNCTNELTISVPKYIVCGNRLNQLIKSKQTVCGSIL